MNKKRALKSAFIIFCGVVVFFAAAYGYLQANLDKPQQAEIKDYTVPYSTPPQDKCVVCAFPSGSALLISLNFTEDCIYLANLDDYDFAADSYYGYNVDFTVNLDYEAIAGIIDRIGGINLEASGEILRYTGVQITEILSVNDEEELKTEIITAIFETISKNGFSNSDFVYIIENSNTDLTVPDCFYWSESFSDMCRRVWFIN